MATATEIAAELQKSLMYVTTGLEGGQSQENKQKGMTVLMNLAYNVGIAI
jgi:hypothetical protein